MKKSKEKGVTLIALVITVAVLAILAFTVTVNLQGFEDTKNKTRFEEDMRKLTEQVEQYYARNKTLPILNEYTNTSMFIASKNVNDSSTYWVLDIAKLGVDSLNFGRDYQTIKDMNNTSADVSQYTNVYIINRGSHTIYYPRGVEYEGKIHYALEEDYTKTNVTITANITLSGANTQTGTPTLQAQVKHTSYTDIEAEKCKWVLSSESGLIGEDEAQYTNTFTQVEEEIPITIPTAGDYYLHVLTVDKEENRKETISNKISVVANYHTHNGNSTTGGNCYTQPVYHSHTGSAAGGGGCYTIPILHQHTAACQGAVQKEATCTVTVNSKSGSGSNGSKYHCVVSQGSSGIRWTEWKATHSSCGQGTTSGYYYNCVDHPQYRPMGGSYPPSTHTYTYTATEIVCGKTAGVTVEGYSLGCGKNEATVEYYNLTCGKTEATIESYTISY